ncbi:MAG: nucleotidyltransferase domain-containing protein [Bdellovibrionota bacterium]
MRLLSKKISNAQIERIVAAKIDWLSKIQEIYQIVLFGSAATKTMTETSDIDLILIFENEAKMKAGKEKIYKSRPVDDWPQDLLFYTKKEFEERVKKGGGVCYIASKEGTIIFRRD